MGHSRESASHFNGRPGFPFIGRPARLFYYDGSPRGFGPFALLALASAAVGDFSLTQAARPFLFLIFQERRTCVAAFSFVSVLIFP